MKKIIILLTVLLLLLTGCGAKQAVQQTETTDVPTTEESTDLRMVADEEAEIMLPFDEILSAPETSAAAEKAKPQTTASGTVKQTTAKAAGKQTTAAANTTKGQTMTAAANTTQGQTMTAAADTTKEQTTAAKADTTTAAAPQRTDGASSGQAAQTKPIVTTTEKIKSEKTTAEMATTAGPALPTVDSGKGRYELPAIPLQ